MDDYLENTSNNMNYIEYFTTTKSTKTWEENLFPFPFVSFVTFVVNILFSSFHVPRQAGVDDYLTG